MFNQKRTVAVFLSLLFAASACRLVGSGRMVTPPPAATIEPATLQPTTESADQAPDRIESTALPTATAGDSSPVAPATEAAVFEVGEEITIPYLRGLKITGSPITFEQELTDTVFYQQHLVSYMSEGNKIYGLLTIPNQEQPERGFKAVVFNHGYIPPDSYRTTERYTAYVDYLARNGLVVFKIDMRGHGNSEGEATGSYFSPGYTIDAIAALKSLQTLDFVDPQGIGMWGHSMAGNLVLRAMLIEPDVQAGVIFAGAVYSYDDFATYGIDDDTFRPRPTPEGSEQPRRSQQIFEAYGRPDTQVDYWRAVSLTENIEFLERPVQIHHAADDPVVSIQYSEGLAAVLLAGGKEYEFYTYEGGGHNLASPYFDQAMLRTVNFLRDEL